MYRPLLFLCSITTVILFSLVIVQTVAGYAEHNYANGTNGNNYAERGYYSQSSYYTQSGYSAYTQSGYSAQYTGYYQSSYSMSGYNQSIYYVAADGTVVYQTQLSNDKLATESYATPPPYLQNSYNSCTPDICTDYQLQVTFDNGVTRYYQGTYSSSYYQSTYNYAQSTYTSTEGGYNEATYDGLSSFFSGSVSGCVFIDSDGDGIKDAGEPNYTGTIDVRLSPTGGTRTFPSAGCYRFSNVPYSNYTLRLFTVPSGYYVTYPRVAGSYSISLGYFTCSISPDNGPPACSLNNITQANFGISNAASWFQTAGGDLRDETGLTNAIPTAPRCSKVTINDGSSGVPGILFIGNGSADSGDGQISSKNWIVGGSGTAYTASSFPTSHAAILTTMTRNKVTPTALSTYCSTDACTINNTIQSGAYRVGGNLMLNAATITNKKVVILVDGDLTIAGNVQVSPGAYLMVVVKGDIIVSDSVGTATFACAGSGTPQLQGVFSTDSNFNIEGKAICPTADLQLQVAGTIISNAGKTTAGKVVNNRTLCAQDALYPSFTIRPRPDFALATPGYILRPSVTWKEVAP